MSYTNTRGQLATPEERAAARDLAASDAQRRGCDCAYELVITATTANRTRQLNAEVFHASDCPAITRGDK